MGDALVELGRYDEAFAAFERMISLRPEPRLVRTRRLRPEAVGDLRRGGRRSPGLKPASGSPSDGVGARELVKLELGLGAIPVGRRHARAVHTPPGISECTRRARTGRGGRWEPRGAIRGPPRYGSHTDRKRVPCSQICSTPTAGRGASSARDGRRDRQAARRQRRAGGSRVRRYRADNLTRPAETVELHASREPIDPRSTATTPSAWRSRAREDVIRRSTPPSGSATEDGPSLSPRVRGWMCRKAGRDARCTGERSTSIRRSPLAGRRGTSRTEKLGRVRSSGSPLRCSPETRPRLASALACVALLGAGLALASCGGTTRRQ